MTSGHIIQGRLDHIQVEASFQHDSFGNHVTPLI
jgi:hypothetical protein